MSEIRALQMDIAASLSMSPASLEDLLQREFLKTKSAYGVEMMLDQMERKEWIYEKNGKYHTYKKTIKDVLNPNGYDIPLNRKPYV